MGRRSSGGRSSRPAPRPAARSPPPQPAPAPAPAPAPSPVRGGSLGGAVAEGMAIGTGVAVAHRAVDAVVGPRTIQHESVASEGAAAAGHGGSDACSIHSKAFQDCLSGYGSDISKCQFYMDLLAECRRNSGSGMTS